LNEKRRLLKLLPEPQPFQPNMELLRTVSGFCSEVGEWIAGSEGHEGLRRSCRTIYKEFKIKVASTHPLFVPFMKNSYEARSGKWEICLPVEDDQHVMDKLQNGKRLVMDLDDVHNFIEEWVLDR
jgi:hypothetical protein